MFHDTVLHLIPVTLHKSLNFSTQVFVFSWRYIQQFLRCCCILAVICLFPLIRLLRALKVMTFELDIAGVPVGEWLKFTMYPPKNEMINLLQRNCRASSSTNSSCFIFTFCYATYYNVLTTAVVFILIRLLFDVSILT